MVEQYSRHINFNNIANFRDLGGYKAHGGRMIAWRKLFRSAEFVRMTEDDLNRLIREIGLSAILDLRSEFEVKNRGIGLISGAGIKYFNISFLDDGGKIEADERRYDNYTNIGQYYVGLIQEKSYARKIIEALEIIAEPDNHPLVFHCAIGKDRTGLLTAFILSALRVDDEDIIRDYTFSGPSANAVYQRMTSDPRTTAAANAFPRCFWDAPPESMALLLTTIKRDYGSTEGYLKENGADASLVKRLEKALLV
jgi:protein-tyrosine phosphatase